MSYVEKEKYSTLTYNDPFSTDKVTTLIHLNPKKNISTIDSSALLSRYSRSSKSMIELLNTEFTNVQRGNDFIKRVLLEYSDDSIAEMGGEQLGIEGLSLIAATKLTDRRIGVSFIEKSTRYVDFQPDSFYIPARIYELSLVDEYKDLCGKSYNTFHHIFKEVKDISLDQFPIRDFNFPDSTTRTNRVVPFEHLSLEKDIKLAEQSYNRSILNKAFDIASYTWLLSLKTNIGIHTNCRALEYMLTNMTTSPLQELNDIGHNLLSLLDKTIHPFITRVQYAQQKNNLGTYTDESFITVFKNNIVKWLRDAYFFSESLGSGNNEEEKQQKQYNINVIKKILTEIATDKNMNIDFDGDKSLCINKDLLNPYVKLVHFMEEKFFIDLICSAILFENNENLLEYDDNNINNIDQSLRILGLNKNNIKNGILYDILNDSRRMYKFDTDMDNSNTISENTLSFNEYIAYFGETAVMNDNLTLDYNSNKSTMDKEQEFLIKRYIGERLNRRNKLGRAFEFINYIIEVSSSAKVMRESKRHRLGSYLYPQIITARNSYDSFIFPSLIQQNRDLFDSYKSLIDDSFTLYKKIVDKSNDYHTAQYALIAGTRCNYTMNVNLRELDHYLSIRTIPHAHEEIRQVCQDIYIALKTVHPNIARLLEFVDMSDYNLGRITAEFKKNKKLSSI